MPIAHRRIPLSLARCCSLLALLPLVGCGNGMVPASGRVEFVDGSAIEGAIRVIRFEPTEDSPAKVKKVASGRLGDNGEFELMTFKPDDGVFCGDYVVTFTVLDNPEASNSLVPLQYTRAESSPLKVTVSSGRSDYLFQLDLMD